MSKKTKKPLQNLFSDSTELMVTSILMVSTHKGKTNRLNRAHPEGERESRGGSHYLVLTSDI